MRGKDSPPEVGDILTRLEVTLERTTARYNPLILAWWWRYELALAVGLPAVIIALTLRFGVVGALAVPALIAALTVAVAMWPAAKHRLLALVWRVITPHRVRAGCVQAGILSQRGRLPVVLRTTSEPFGERLYLWCRSGTSAEDFLEARKLLAAACWAADVHVFANARYAQLVTLDVIRQPLPMHGRPGVSREREAPPKREEWPRVRPRTREEKKAGPRDRYLVGRVTEKVEVGRDFFLSLQVKVTRPKPTAGVSQFLMPVDRGGELQAILVADPLFLVLTGDKVEVPVPQEGEGPERGFTLRAQHAGAGLLRVDVYRGTQALKTFQFPVTVTEADTESEMQAASVGVPETPAPSGLIRIVLTGPKERRIIQLVAGDKFLADHPLEIGESALREQLRRITAQLNAFTDSTARGSITRKRGELHGLGKQIYSRLLPGPFVEEFRAHRSSATSLAIQGSSPLPWELMADSDDDRFLAEELRMTRWLHGSVPGAPIRLGNAIFACTEGLEGARKEIEEIRQLTCPGQEPAIIAESVQLHQRMKAGDFDLFHFAGHTLEDKSGTTALDFGNDDDYTLNYMANVPARTLYGSRPVIFLNACGSASGLGRQTLFEDWAEMFIDRGAGAFIGSLWNIRSDTANMFAIDLYRSIREEAASTLGEAVEFARHSSSSDPSDPTRLAYALYGRDDADVILNP